MNIISVKQLRERFDTVKTGIQEGKSFILVHRSHPLAEIRPFGGTPVFEDAEAEKTERIRKAVDYVRQHAGGFKLGKGWTPARMKREYDRDIYDRLLR